MKILVLWLCLLLFLLVHPSIARRPFRSPPPPPRRSLTMKPRKRIPLFPPPPPPRHSLIARRPVHSPPPFVGASGTRP
ncbi:hypothetical protein O6P43_001596 [Quillaja saponaria]|uniref:Uncharacterized protein n=1 Tax=Quillaja saponaria TaxID=32244 RepID=A0AAD7QJL4_QUISA|nr:hypothetical protein O6P43_001596 [Quillaja saponaria]